MQYMKKAVTFRLDPDLIQRVDEARGDVSRTRFLERALEAKLQPKISLGMPKRNHAMTTDPPGPATYDSRHYKCPRNCRSSVRPTSPDVRCPDCRSKVIPAD